MDSSGYGALHWNLTQEKLISYRWSFVQNFVNQSLKYKPLVGEGRARLDVGLMGAYKIYIKKLGRFSPKALSNSHKWARKRAVPSSRACFTHRVASLLRGGAQREANHWIVRRSLIVLQTYHQQPHTQHLQLCNSAISLLGSQKSINLAYNSAFLAHKRHNSEHPMRLYSLPITVTEVWDKAKQN